MKLLDRKALRDKGITYSGVQLWRLSRDGKFPKPIKLSDAGRVAWIESEIDEWIEARVAARDRAA